MNAVPVLAVALATMPAILTVWWASWQHNRRVDDLRDVLRAEMKANTSDLLRTIEKNHSELLMRIVQIENRIEHLESAAK